MPGGRTRPRSSDSSRRPVDIIADAAAEPAAGDVQEGGREDLKEIELESERQESLVYMMVTNTDSNLHP